jgi:hypothetical protein
MNSEDEKGSCTWHLLDIPSSFSPCSLASAPLSLAPPNEPYKLVEPRGKGLFDLDGAWGELHDKISKLAELALGSAIDAGNKVWCNQRLVMRDRDDDDIRPWGKMLQLQTIFESPNDMYVLSLAQKSEH